MKWVVCRNKDDNSLFITTRTARETLLNVLMDLGQEIPSNVLRQFENYDDALEYKNNQEREDKIIANTLNKKP